MYDIVFSGGNVIDGTSAPAITADVAVTGDRIEAVGTLASAAAKQTVDCRGRVIASGLPRLSQPQ